MTETPLPFPVAGAVRFYDMAQFHPLKFLAGACKGLRIYENTFIQKLDGTTAFYSGGQIRAKKIILCTHYPFVNSHGLYFMKLYQKRSYVLAVENAPQLGCAILADNDRGIFLRNYQKLLLVSGGDHRTGKKGAGLQTLRHFVRTYYPQAAERYAWANQDCVSLDGLPYIGPYSEGLPDVYVATGFNLWGMSNSMAAATLLTDLVLGRDSALLRAVRPNRSMLHGQLFSNLGTTLVNFVTPTVKRCPHMGCALKWNADEQSWDCPCHGSRFDAHGRLINNPAMKDAHVE